MRSKKIYFEEVQTFRQSTWIWMLWIAFSTGVIIPVLQGLHTQLVMRIPWGDKPMSDNALIGLTAFIICIIIFAACVLWFCKLQITIDEEALSYKVSPHENKWMRITPQEINNYAIIKKLIAVSPGINKFKKWADGNKHYNLTDKRHLVLKLKNETQVALGVKNYVGLEWAIKRMLEKNQVF